MLKLPKVKSILYVEDEKAIQEELAEVLENFCDTLYLADDGSIGLEYYKKYKPDIVVSDIKMPNMDGIEMSKLIKKEDKDVHIVFTTAFSDMEFFQAAIELQVDGYILKPISLDALEKKLISIINGIDLEREILEKEQMLFQTSKLAAMGEMIGNIAHQWKQPLSTISMSVNNLKADISLNKLNPDSTLEYANSVESQVKYLSRTIDEFRSFLNHTVLTKSTM